MVTWDYTEEEVPAGVREGARTFQHRLVGNSVSWPMRTVLEAYLTHHFGPKHDLWRLKYTRQVVNIVPGVRQSVGYNAVLRFTSKHDAMMFKLSWPH